MNPSTLQAEFRRRFSKPPRIYRAPGRVNLIGEHTDYNEGLVMPAAIDLFTWVAIAPTGDRRIRVYSAAFSEMSEMSLDIPPARRSHWSDYVFGVVHMLQHSGYRLQGAELLIDSEVPIGSGLSSSAAIEVASAYALLDSGGHFFSGESLALMSQQAENDFVGTRCGIMDQFIATFGKSDKALMLDCRSLDYDLLPLPSDARIVICNTMVRHKLASGEYNARRSDCETAVQILSKGNPTIRALRDVTLAELDFRATQLSERVYRRAVHVITENLRVQEAAQALRSNDLERFGGLMGESHLSLRDNYQVSCAELDIMVKLAGQFRGVYGSRMTGAGFGGCTVNIVQSDCVGGFISHMREGYEQLTMHVPEIYACLAAQGVQEVRAQ